MGENQLTPAEIDALIGQSAPRSEVVSIDADSHYISQQSIVERKRRNRLWAISEQAARDIGVALSATLRTAVDVRLTSIEMVSCQALAASMETPTCVCLLRSPSLVGQFVLEMPPAILLPMLDRMLGGNVNTIFSASPRQLSEIEQRLAMRLASSVAGDLNRAWASTFAFGWEIDRVETDARWISIGPPSSHASVTSFDVRLGKSHGALRFGIPPQAMDMLDRHLLAEQPTPISGPHYNATDHSEVAEDQARLTVELDSSPAKIDDVMNLNVGDIIATEHRIDSPVIVNLDGEPKFLGRLGSNAGRKAVRIENPIDS